LAKEGHHLVRAQYKHDVITNERTGKGTLHVRADDRQELNSIKNNTFSTNIVINNFNPRMLIE